MTNDGKDSVDSVHDEFLEIPLRDKGEMYCNPCRYFRDLEAEQQAKGIGDGQDGGICGEAEETTIIYQNSTQRVLGKSQSSIIVEPALNTPVFCMRKCLSEKISVEYRGKLRAQFPKHTHALIIDDEKSFLENVRYNMKSKAFAHEIYYGDKLYTDFWDFVYSGTSDICFYTPKPKKRYYMGMRYEPIDKAENQKIIRIDDSNYFKTMYRKDSFFAEQNEYRIVLPYEKISKGTIYNISPFSAQIIKIDDLVEQ